MPSHKEHCEESLRRYGKTFSELHRWMDEPSEIVGSKHRVYRHDPYTTPKVARALFGEYADQACLDHIRADRMASSARGLTTYRKKSELSIDQQRVLLLFSAFFLFILGLVTVPTAQRYGGWMWFPFLCSWGLAFFLFLGFIGSFMEEKPKLTEEVYHYELEMPQYSIFKEEDEKQKEEKTTNNKNGSKD